jgi:uroporphyrinogen-III decarboxylase
VNVLTPGCALAPHTPLENIRAMTRAARAWTPVQSHSVAHTTSEES